MKCVMVKIAVSVTKKNLLEEIHEPSFRHLWCPRNRTRYFHERSVHFLEVPSFFVQQLMSPACISRHVMKLCNARLLLLSSCCQPASSCCGELFISIGIGHQKPRPFCHHKKILEMDAKKYSSSRESLD